MKMYDRTEVSAACFDPNNMQDSTNINAINSTTSSTIEQNVFSHETNNNNISPSFPQLDHNQEQLDSNTMELDYQNPNDNNLNNWTTTNIHNVSHEMSTYPNFDETNINIHTSTSDLLTLLHLPGCSFPNNNNNNNPSISFAKSSPPPPQQPSGLASFLGEMNMTHENGPVYDPISAATLPYDPLFHLNLPPQPSPLLRDLMFQSLPHGYNPRNMNGNGIINGNCSLFGQMEDGEGSNNNNSMNMNMNTSMNVNGFSGLYQEGGEQHIMNHNDNNNNNPIFEFSGGVSLDDNKKLGKGSKVFVTERQRRQNFNYKYEALRGLIPTPTKVDRASIVQDAISYIEELKRTVSELKLLVDKKRISRERTKRLKTEDNTNNPSDENGGHGLDTPGVVKSEPEEAFASSSATQLRSSWLQRKCKDTEVDVRIVDDEVTIKLVQRKKMNCLLSVSRTLDDLQLDLRHVAGGHVGDYYSYLFNSKICEGSSVYASAIANKLIEVVERQYAAASVAIAPSSSF